MERIWAPWRGDYVTGAKNPEGCFFCRKGQPGDDAARHILFRGRDCFVLLNRYPYNSGHLMIAPYRHTADFAGLSPREAAELLKLAQDSVRVLEERVKPQGFNLGFNLGRSAGAGVADHLHLHVVPRWDGDTNFMPVLGATRVMPQSLEEVYGLLRSGFEQSNPSSTN